MRTWNSLFYTAVTTTIASACLVGVGSSAHAADAGNAPTYDTTIVESASSSSSDSNASVTSVNGFKLRAAMKNRVLAYVNANGMPENQQNDAKSITLDEGRMLKTSYVNIHGQEVWHNKFYAKGYTFYKGPDGWFHDPKCNNKVVIKAKKQPPKGHIFVKGKVKVVKKFKFSGTASASLHELAIAGSTSRSIGYVIDHAGNMVRDENGKPLINCEAGANGSGRGEVSASGFAQIKGRVFYTYKAAYEALLQGAAHNMQLNLESKNYSLLTVKGQVRAEAKGSAESKASAFTWCRNSQLPPPPEPPVVTNPPAVSASPEVCTAPGGKTPNTVTVTGTNNDDVARTLVFRVTDSNGQVKTAERSVAPNTSVTVTFSGLVLGNVTYSVTAKETSKSATGSTTLIPCPDNPPAENNPPTGTISGLPHQYSNATDSNVAYVYWMTRDSDGDTVTYNNFRVINSGGATAHAGNVLPSAVLADGTACPTGAKCYRGEVWAGTTPGSASVAVDITDGKSNPVTLSAGPWTIFADDRGE